MQRPQRFLFVLVLLFASAPAIAGDVYNFTYGRRGGLVENVKKGAC